MSFIRDMLIRKWTCFCAVRKVTDNDLGLCDGGFMRKDFSKPLLQNQCYMQYDLQKLLTIKY